MATYYVSTLGDDGNDGLSIETAWQTVDYAVQQLTGSDVLRILADGEYTMTSAPYLEPSPNYRLVRIVGANALGVVDGTRPIINCSASAYIYCGSTSIVVENLHFQGVNRLGYGVWVNVGRVRYVARCSFDNLDIGGYGGTYFACYFNNCNYGQNTGGGSSHNVFRGCGEAFKSSSLSNSIAISCSTGFNSEAAGSFYNCLAYDCTTGYRVRSAGVRFVQCSAVNCTMGWDQSLTTIPTTELIDCHHHGCTTALDPELLLEITNLVTGDPLFTSTTPGSEDFTPLPGSPLIMSGGFFDSLPSINMPLRTIIGPEAVTAAGGILIPRNFGGGY